MKGSDAFENERETEEAANRILLELLRGDSRVLDIGCGRGELLERLGPGEFNVGVDIDREAVIDCIARGLNVIMLDATGGLGCFADDSFDTAVLNRTIEVLSRPDLVLREMLRVAPRAICFVPNFGHWRVRLQLLCGFMPKTAALPFEWYDTPNIHHTTLADFVKLVERCGGHIERAYAVSGARLRRRLFLPNLRAEWGCFIIERAGDSAQARREARIAPTL